MTNLAVGVDLGGTSIKAGLVSIEKGLLSKTSCNTDAHEGPAAVLDRISSLISRCIANVDLPHPVFVGIGSPGAVNWERTTISHPPNFPDWKLVNVEAEIGSRQSIPVRVVVENDANVAALGSARFGEGRSFPSFIMVTLGTGVGGAIFYNGELFRGTTGGAGELGPMSIDYEGPLAMSGVAGAIEAYIGQRFLSRRARFALRNNPGSIAHKLAKKSGSKITPEILFEAARRGDSASRDILAWAGDKLGTVLGAAALAMSHVHAPTVPSLTSTI